MNAPLCRKLLTCKKPDYPSTGECGNLSWMLPLLLHTWCWLLSGRGLPAWPIRLIWCHRSSVWKLKVASLLKDELETAACINLLFVAFPSQFPCSLLSPFSERFALYFFVPQTNDHKGQLQVILKCFIVFSKYRLIFLCHPPLRSTDCKPKGSMKED